jgi:succinate dehydrogenase hydrophobic membrane anchor protein
VGDFMTGLFVWRLQRLTALMILFYGLYLILVPIIHLPFNVNHLIHKVLLTILFIAIATHTRIGIWAVVTDYIPYSYQQIILRIIELYIIFMAVWGLLILW